MSNDTTFEIMELHQHEMQLLRHLRQVGFGEITIIMRDSLPVKMKRIIEFTDLDKK